MAGIHGQTGPTSDLGTHLVPIRPGKTNGHPVKVAVFRVVSGFSWSG